MNAFIFGDVHGDSSALRNLIQKAKLLGGPNLGLFSVGDLLDRGPDSKGVLDFCIQEGVQGILGNHELWMHQYLSMGEFNDFALHGIMGGKKTLLSYGFTEEELTHSSIESKLQWKVPTSHKEYLLNMPLFRVIVVGGVYYRITHGGIPQNAGHGATQIFENELLKKGVKASSREISDNVLKLFAQSQSEVFMWAGAKRSQVFRFPDGSFQVFGHTPWKGGAEINTEDNYIALDTGCGTCPPYILSGVLLLENGERTILTSR